MPLFATTIAGSLPKPAWLAEPNRLWAPWRAAGTALADAKRDATVLALKLQEDCGIDVVTDGERVCVPHLPPSDAPRFCPYARMTRESSVYRPRSAETEK